MVELLELEEEETQTEVVPHLRNCAHPCVKCKHFVLEKGSWELVMKPCLNCGQEHPEITDAKGKKARSYCKMGEITHAGDRNKKFGDTRYFVWLTGRKTLLERAENIEALNRKCMFFENMEDDRR